MDLAQRIDRVMRVGETRLVSSLAKSLRVRRAEIEDAVYGAENLDLLVGIRCGSGHGDFPRSEWEVEKFQEI